VNFKYNIETNDGHGLIELSGILIAPNQTTSLIEEVEEVVLEGIHNLVVDLSGIESMNSTGLNVLISILTKARNAGGEAIVTKVPDKVNELMVITKLNTVFTVSDSVEDAVALLNKEKQTWL